MFPVSKARCDNPLTLDFCKRNVHGMPTAIVYVGASIVSCFPSDKKYSYTSKLTLALYNQVMEECSAKELFQVRDSCLVNERYILIHNVILVH